MGKKGFVGAVKGKNDDIRKLVEGEVPDVPKEVKEELVKKLAEDNSEVDNKGTSKIKGGSQPVTRPNQVHHFASNKSTKYTSQFESITNKYGLDLDDVWNKELMTHQGRHPNAYHDWILEELQSIDKVAKGNSNVFLELFEGIKNTVKENPDMLRKSFWD
jgi:hypothetical protein